MNNLVYKRITCRLCESSDLILAMPIKPSPIADAFVDIRKIDVVQPLIPLDLYQCQDCGHVQNIDVVNPALLFKNYTFFTGNSDGLVKHFRKYAATVIKGFNVPLNSLIVEIGSNDGTLLHFFKKKGMRVQGIDPAIKIAEQANKSGIPTVSDFFTSTIATKIKQTKGTAKLVIANNVYAHSDQLTDITKGIFTLLDEDGVFVFECSYLLDIIDNFIFDTVYHEHLSYHSISPLARFFAKLGLHLFDIQRIGTKGGSLRGFVQKKEGPYTERSIIQETIEEEIRRGLNKPDIFHKYDIEIILRKNKLLEFIENIHDQGKTIVGYGASTTVTTLMYHFDLYDKLEYLIDDNPMKHGLYSPGCHLEVKSSSELYINKPDVVIILAWQYSKPIIRKHSNYIQDGGKFIIPLPNIKIIDI